METVKVFKDIPYILDFLEKSKYKLRNKSGKVIEWLCHKNYIISTTNVAKLLIYLT